MVSGVFVLDYKWCQIFRKMVVVCLIFERMLRLCFSLLYIYLLYGFYYLLYIFSDKRYANDIMLNISNMKCLFEWFVQNLILFHCSFENKG